MPVAAPAAPVVRSNFADTALWVGVLETDKTGRAQVKLNMPENLTSWKVKVWGMGHGTKVGEGEAEVVTRKNVVVRLQAPRFFVETDEVVLSANVHNYLKKAKDFTVSLETEGPLKLLDQQVRTFNLAAGGEQRVDWRVKVTGEGHSYVRNGGAIDGPAIVASVDASLKRLQTDYIDLYQMHWPNRGSYHFRQCWTFDPTSQSKGMTDHVHEILSTADGLIKAGKIRAIGMSNETTWGMAQWLGVSAATQLPRVAALQNEYSLLCRLADLDLAELCHHEDVPILAYSPLAAGMLSGKYAGDAIPPGSRRSINGVLGGRYSEHSAPVCAQYVDVAKRHGLDPVTMAVSFLLSRPISIIPIIGGTTLDQLRPAIAAVDTPLSDNVLADIADVHRRNPMPM